MRSLKRVSVFTLAVVLLMSLLLVPAQAMERQFMEPIDLEWRTVFYGFPTQTTGSNSVYTGAVQSFLYASSNTKADIVNNGGIDRIYGAGTVSAMKTFQREYNSHASYSIRVDGGVGKETWPAIAAYLCQDPVNGYQNWYRYDEAQGVYGKCLRYRDGEIGYYKENRTTIGGEFIP